MKKIRILCVFFLVLFHNFLLAQEVYLHKQGLKYDFRALLLDAPEHNFDVLHYQFEWIIDIESHRLQGEATIRARSLIDSLSNISIHLANNMEVTRISQYGTSLSFNHQGDLLEIYLMRYFNADEEFEMDIEYHGSPQSGLYFTSHQDQPIVYSLDEPTLARNWFPCYDLPDDKATAELRITVPDDMIVASNGKLINTTDNRDHTMTYHWKEDYPISTYLISVAATNYETFSDFYASNSESMEVKYFVYPEHLTLAQEDFSMTISMLEFYSQAFGEYPFIKEKYGMAVIPGRVSMEHQTCTSYSSSLITGTHRYDYIIAHELAHQWWGDLVTLTDWADIWLNEGFATYSNALWFENLYGFAGLKSRMADFKNIYLNHHDGAEHPIYDPPLGHLFCVTEYQKAAWVLHMLRFVVGEEKFWKILRKYAEDYAYSNATTQDFRDVCEQVHGSDLGWFFQQWIYQAGYPTYEFSWYYSNQKGLRVTIHQSQEDFPLFEMPVELQIVLPSGIEKKVVWVNKKYNSFYFALEETPLTVLFDPDNWILCQVKDFTRHIEKWERKRRGLRRKFFENFE